MPKGNYYIPEPSNEPVLTYAPDTSEREDLKAAVKAARNEERDIPMYIGGEEVRTGKRLKMTPPYDHQHVLGYFHEGDSSHVKQAIDAAIAAKEAWSGMAWEHRASIFLKRLT